MTSHETSARDKQPARETLLSAEDWLADHGDALYRYAWRRVGKPDVAEDLVQDTFLAAIKSSQRFRGDAGTRTWLVSILRRKIVDYYRQLAAARDAIETEQPAATEQSRLFTADGLWRETIASWTTPPDILEHQEFWSVLQGCLARLPKHLASAFVLRELEERESGELREILNLSPGNLRVRLFRARQLLRECLEKRWFGGEHD